MCKDHDVDILARKCDKVRDTLFDMGLRKLEKRWETKRMYEAQIREFVKEAAGENEVKFVTAVQREPNTVVKLRVSIAGCDVVHGTGFSKCWKDKWDASKGFLIAFDKAVRDAARQLAGL